MNQPHNSAEKLLLRLRQGPRTLAELVADGMTKSEVRHGLKKLRDTGTTIYSVVAPGEAMRYELVKEPPSKASKV